MQRRKSVRLTFATLGLCLSSSISAGMVPAGVEGAIAADPGNQQPGRFAQTDRRKAEADRLLQQGIEQFQTSQFEAALQPWQQALSLYRQIQDRRGEGNALGKLGIAYFSLGNYPQAIAYQEQHLAIAREIKDRQGEGQSLGNLGLAYDALGNYPQAIAYQEQHLAIAREIKDRRGEGATLGNLGNAYFSLGNYPKAIAYHEQSLAIARELKDRQGEGQSLGNLGLAYDALGNYPQAIAYQEQHLAIAREIKDPDGERIALNNIAVALEKQQQPELAILFYKESVNVIETIRTGLKPLSRQLQESYTQTVAGTYRQLADLLLAQGRVLEAQQVLELLKIQELRDFTRDTRAGGATKGAPLNAVEAPVKPPFDNLIDHRILHIATHGKFVSEDPEQSFLVLGNGQPLKVPNIRNLSDLGSIHLAVLSACETAKGGPDKEGIEVAGLSYYFLTQNVKSVIASLWLVNDASTSLLMQQFYKHLATGKMTKAEALRQAQLSLLTKQLTAKDALRGGGVGVTGPAARATGNADFAHPYYWPPLF